MKDEADHTDTLHSGGDLTIVVRGLHGIARFRSIRSVHHIVRISYSIFLSTSKLSLLLWRFYVAKIYWSREQSSALLAA